MTSDQSMRTDYLRLRDPHDPCSHCIVVGVYDTHYRANTVYEIDANLEDLRGDHPDVDRLLDARRIIAPLNAVWPARCSLDPDQKCPPGQFTGCPCSRRIAEEHSRA